MTEKNIKELTRPELIFALAPKVPPEMYHRLLKWPTERLREYLNGTPKSETH